VNTTGIGRHPEESSYPIPISGSNTPGPTIQTTEKDIATQTPELYERIPTTEPQILLSLPQTIQRILTKNTWYQERIQKDIIFHIALAQNSSQSSLSSLIVFWVKVGVTKDGQRTLMFSPTIASVLVADGSDYREQWNTEQWSVQNGLENPLLAHEVNTGWYQKRFQVIDITGDRNPEIILSGCGGFGNQCHYSLGAWSLNGDKLFTTTSDPNEIGATISKTTGVIIVRKGFDYYQYNSVEMRPKQIELDYHTWNGSSFVISKTEIQPFVDWDKPNTE
jgi:hypothetical protein